MTLILRDYQQDAQTAVFTHLAERADNPCVVIPTGGGKSPLMASIASSSAQNGMRVLILAHVKELLAQTRDKLLDHCPDLPIGLHSAGFNQRDTDEPIIVAGIQSVFREPEKMGRWDLVMVDEAHLIPPSGEGMYQSFLAGAKELTPAVRVVGFTATPYRLESGPICKPHTILNHICYSISVKTLMEQGWLTKLIGKSAKNPVDTSRIKKTAGEFNAAALEAAMGAEGVVMHACDEIVSYTRDTRKSVLMFCVGIQHARTVLRIMQEYHGLEAEIILGETPSAERADTIARFVAGDLQYLVNVGVLTTGFDAPMVDCVSLLRPTLSPGLYYQMVGRGFRIAPGKEDCLVLDFGENAKRHGPVDQIEEPAEGDEKPSTKKPKCKICPRCHAIYSLKETQCPDCGFVPPNPRRMHTSSASNVPVLSSGEARMVAEREDGEWCEVMNIAYAKHHSKYDATKPPTLRVDYSTRRPHGGELRISMWLVVKPRSTGAGRHKAKLWWSDHVGTPLPTTVDQAIDELNLTTIPRVATHIYVARQRDNPRYSEVLGWRRDGPVGELSEVEERAAAWNAPMWDIADEVPIDTQSPAMVKEPARAVPLFNANPNDDEWWDKQWE